MIAVDDLKRPTGPPGRRGTTPPSPSRSTRCRLATFSPAWRYGRAHDVLDVATGTGNIALRAAAAGAHVVGLDLTPELFETARRAAERAWRRDRLGRGRRRGSCPSTTRASTSSCRSSASSSPRATRWSPRAGTRVSPRRADRARQLDPRGPDRRAVQDHGRATCRPSPTTPRRPRSGAAKSMSAACSPTRRSSSSSSAGSTRGASTPPSMGRVHRDPLRPDPQGARAPDAEGRWDECRDEIHAMAERRNEATDGSLLMQAEYLVAVGTKAEG